MCIENIGFPRRIYTKTHFYERRWMAKVTCPSPSYLDSHAYNQSVKICPSSSLPSFPPSNLKYSPSRNGAHWYGPVTIGRNGFSLRTNGRNRLNTPVRLKYGIRRLSTGIEPNRKPINSSSSRTRHHSLTLISHIRFPLPNSGYR